MIRLRTAAIFVCLLGLSLIAAVIARAEVPVPPLKTRVLDLTATLDAQQLQTLEKTLKDFEQRKGSQVAVLIVPTTKPESVEQYAVRVEEIWKLGRKGVDDGVLLLIAKDDHKLRIEVGYGLEGALPDVTAKRIIDESIAPHFKRGDFYWGINAGVDQIVRVIDGEKLPPPQVVSKRSSKEKSPEEKVLFVIEFFGAFIAFVFALISLTVFGFLRFLLALTLGVLTVVGTAEIIAVLEWRVVLGIVVFATTIGLFAYSRRNDQPEAIPQRPPPIPKDGSPGLRRLIRIALSLHSGAIAWYNTTQNIAAWQLSLLIGVIEFGSIYVLLGYIWRWMVAYAERPRSKAELDREFAQRTIDIANIISSKRFDGGSSSSGSSSSGSSDFSGGGGGSGGGGASGSW